MRADARALYARALRVAARMPFPVVARKSRYRAGRGAWAWARAWAGPQLIRLARARASTNARDMFTVYSDMNDAAEITRLVADGHAILDALEELQRLPPAVRDVIFDSKWHHGKQ